jgi:predicted nuclease with TOPRIM domain
MQLQETGVIDTADIATMPFPLDSSVSLRFGERETGDLIDRLATVEKLLAASRKANTELWEQLNMNPGTQAARLKQLEFENGQLNMHLASASREMSELRDTNSALWKRVNYAEARINHSLAYHVLSRIWHRIKSC